jgi:hypothetical protein
MSDKFTPAEKITPFDDLITASKSDTVNQPTGVCRGFMVAEDGNIRFLTARGTEQTIPVSAGVVYPIRVLRVFDTSTTTGNVFLGY